MIVHEDEYAQKVKNFISNNEAIETSEHIRAKFQKDVRTILNEPKQLVDTHQKMEIH